MNETTVTVYVTFFFSAEKGWEVSVNDMPPEPGCIGQHYRMKIPVPDELMPPEITKNPYLEKLCHVEGPGGVICSHYRGHPEKMGHGTIERNHWKVTWRDGDGRIEREPI